MKKFILSIVCFYALGQANAIETWTVKAPMPSPTTTFGIASVDSMIYCIGGADVTGVLSSVYAYNVYTDVWTTKTSMSTARGELGVAQVAGKIYAIGGFTSAGALNVVEEYDPATDTWTTKSPMPTARSQFSVSVIGNKIYAIGGYPGSYATLEIYDPTTDSWSTGSSMSFGRIQGRGAATLGGKLFFVGGKNYANNVYYDSCSIYDPSSDTWSTGTNMPFQRFAGSIAYANSRLYYFGGAIGTPASPEIPNFNSNVYYDSTSGSWVTALSCLKKRSSGSAVEGANGKIYYIGGLDSVGNVVDWNHEYAPDYLTTNVSEYNSAGNVSVYPVPCDGRLMVNVGNLNAADCSFNVVSISGQIIEVPFTYTNGIFSADMTNVASGVYIVQLNSKDEIYKQSIIVK